MEDRVQGIEQALQQAVQQLAAMQVQQAQTEQQLREAREAAATATAAAAAAGKGVRAGEGGVAGGTSSGGGPHGFGIDTRMLGRPDTFDGSESKWGDWRTVMKAYAALCNASLVSAMPASEVEAQEKRNSDLRDQLDVEASVALYYMLVLLTRNEPLNIVVNSGAGEGLLAWRRLVQRYDSAAATRLAGLLLNLMNWSFAGDIQSRMELFDRELQRYETRAREAVSLNLRVGMVLNGLDKGPLKDHLLLNSAKYLTWQEFKSEIVNYRRATQAVADSGGAVPMDVGAFTKGDEGRGRGAGKGTQDQTCHNCGRRGHFLKDCKNLVEEHTGRILVPRPNPNRKERAKVGKVKTETKRLSMLLRTTTRRSTMMRKSKNSQKMRKDWVQCVCFEQTACWFEGRNCHRYRHRQMCSGISHPSWFAPVACSS